MRPAARWAISARLPRKPISSPARIRTLRAIETLTRTRKAVEGGAFKAEIVPITLTEKAGPRIVANGQHPLKVDPAKIPGLEAGVPRQRYHHAGRLLRQC